MDNELDTENKRIGKIMIYLAWVVIFAMLVWVFGVLEKNKRNPNQNVSTQVLSGGQKQVVLESSSYGHYIATGRINNSEVTFLVDTGASHISVPESVAKKIGLKQGAPTRVSTANGTITVYATTLDQVSIGEISLNDIRANINPYMQGDEILLGMSFLRSLSVTHEDEQLTIRQ